MGGHRRLGTPLEWSGRRGLIGQLGSTRYLVAYRRGVQCMGLAWLNRRWPIFRIMSEHDSSRLNVFSRIPDSPETPLDTLGDLFWGLGGPVMIKQSEYNWCRRSGA